MCAILKGTRNIKKVISTPNATYELELKQVDEKATKMEKSNERKVKRTQLHTTVE